LQAAWTSGAALHVLVKGAFDECPLFFWLKQNASANLFNLGYCGKEIAEAGVTAKIGVLPPQL
jgi:hypothetical protein